MVLKTRSIGMIFITKDFSLKLPPLVKEATFVFVKTLAGGFVHQLKPSIHLLA
jgi:hypothetical protein